MMKFTVQNNLSKAKMQELAKKYGKSAVQETAEHLFQDSQNACPVKSGKLKESGYIKEIGNGYEIGYSADYAQYVDKMPQAWLSRTGHGGKTHFLTGAAQRYAGGGINVK
jgi:hypothetical protein